MDRWSQNKAEVAKAVWDRLLGCFGDGLLRKFGAEPPPEWVAGISMLSAAQHERGFRRLLYGWKGAPPSLPDFMRLCRSVGDEFDEGPKPIALPPPAPGSGFNGDEWGMAANKYLLGHIVKHTCANAQRYANGGLPLLLEAKRHWAADMRDQAVNGAVDAEIQKAVWRDYFDRAEQAITASGAAA